MNRADKFMPQYWGDYHRDTRHLATIEHGAYLLLIGHYWTSASPLPKDEDRLRQITGLSRKEWQKHGSTLMAFFIDTPCGWRHKRIDRELEEARKRYEKRAAAGQKGNSTRWSDRNATSETTPPASQSDRNATNKNIAMRSQCGSQPQPQPQRDLPPLSQTPTRRPVESEVVGAMIRVLDEAVETHFQDPIRPRHPTDRAIAEGWIERGITPEQAAAVIEPIVGRMAANKEQAPATLKFFLNPMQRAIAAGIVGGGSPAPPDAAQSAAAKAYSAAVAKWANDGREGPGPKPEDYGWTPRKDAA